LNSFLHCEENDYFENEFSFKVCSKVYKSSSISPAIFSKRTFSVLKNENQFCVVI
jgi:hypothetical protein